MRLKTGNPTKRRATAGFTVLEIMIAAALFSLVAGAGAMVMSTSYEAYEASLLKSTADSKAHRAAANVVEALDGIGSVFLVPNPTGDFGAGDVTFRTATGVDGGGAPTWGVTNRLSVAYAPGEVDDGIDNNGDGLVDECVLLFTLDDGGANESTVTLCNNVSEYLEGETPNGADDNGNLVRDERGFNVHRTGDVITIRVTVLEPVPSGGMATSTAETSVLLRN